MIMELSFTLFINSDNNIILLFANRIFMPDSEEKNGNPELPDHISASLDKLGPEGILILISALESLNAFLSTTYLPESTIPIDMEIIPKLNSLVKSELITDSDLQVLLEWVSFEFKKTDGHWKFTPHDKDLLVSYNRIRLQIELLQSHVKKTE